MEDQFTSGEKYFKKFTQYYSGHRKELTYYFKML